MSQNTPQIEQLLQQLLENQTEILALLKDDSFFKKLRRRFSPKLGVLSQYSPIAIDIPSCYYKRATMSHFPTISIVTPAYAHGHFIETTIQSVLEQQYPALEYIIKDGGSKDNTVDILKKYVPQLAYWESTKDTGQSQAINIGFSHAHGEIMAYLNSDDLLLPGALHYVADYFAKHPEVDAVYGHRILIDENNDEIGRWILPPHQDKILAWADYIPQETLFWRRTLWEKVNAHIDESFQFAMDWDLILRFIAASGKLVRLPRFLGAFRIHPHQKSSAEISKIGKQDMARLRVRCHGHNVTMQEIKRHTRYYLWYHILLHKLYRLGLLKY